MEEVPTYNQTDLRKLLINYIEDLKNNEFAKNTIKIYRRSAERLIEGYTSDEVMLSKGDVIQFKEDLIDEYNKPQTINSYITGVNRFLHYCEQDALKVLKVKSQGNNVLETRIYRQEYVRMVNKAKAINNMQLHYIMKVMGRTGVRVNELKAFTVEALKGQSVEVNNKGKIRSVPIPGDLLRELRAYGKREKFQKEIFVLSYSEIYNGLKRLAGICKIKKAKIYPHAFRHYFGFRFVELNGDLSLAQLADILGHSSIETTRVYTRGTLEDYKKKVESM